MAQTDDIPLEASRQGIHKDRLIIFLVLTFVLSALCYLLMAVSDIVREIAFLPLMWTPGASALLAQRLSGGRARDLGFRWGQSRWQMLALAVPVGVPAVVYAATWITGLGALNSARLAELSARMFGSRGSSMIASVLTYLLFMGTIGLAAAVVCGLGEEIGWRGLLLPELAKRMSFTRAALLSGAVWAVWHYPFMIFFGYHGSSPLWYGIASATLAMIAASVFMAWLRLRSGSVWTAAIFHGTHNIFVQEIFDPFTSDTGPTEWIVGEFGLAIAAAYAVVAFIFWRRRDAVEFRDQPSDSRH